jgi:hypothetical protein
VAELAHQGDEGGGVMPMQIGSIVQLSDGPRNKIAQGVWPFVPRVTAPTGGIDVLESTFSELHRLLSIAKARIERYAPETGSDAPHWLMPMVDVFDQACQHIEQAQCVGESCGSLATWLHPDDPTDRYCGSCRDRLFIQCTRCKQTIRLDDAVGDPMTCEGCQGGDEK